MKRLKKIVLFAICIVIIIFAIIDFTNIINYEISRFIVYCLIICLSIYGSVSSFRKGKKEFVILSMIVGILYIVLLVVRYLV